MKKILRGLLALAVLVGLAIVITTSKQTVRPAYAQGGCSVATLTGNYGFTFSGFSNHSPKGQGSTLFPLIGGGLGTFDGAGDFSATFANSFNGASSTGNSYTATYTVNSDCTGSFTSTNGGDNFAFVIVSGGAEILATDLSLGETVSLDLKKQ